MTALACAGARLPVSSYTNAMDSTALSAVVHRAEMGPDPGRSLNQAAAGVQRGGSGSLLAAFAVISR